MWRIYSFIFGNCKSLRSNSIYNLGSRRLREVLPCFVFLFSSGSNLKTKSVFYPFTHSFIHSWDPWKSSASALNGHPRLKMYGINKSINSFKIYFHITSSHTIIIIFKRTYKIQWKWYGGVIKRPGGQRWSHPKTKRTKKYTIR